MNEEDFSQIREQVGFYEKYGSVFHRGDLFRLKNPEDGNITALEFISEDKNTVIVMLYSMQGLANSPVEYINLQGLEKGAVYKKTQNGEMWSADTLMNVGIPFLTDFDYKNKVWIFEKQ